MGFILRTMPVVLLAILLSACNYITFTPHSTKKKQKEKPSVILLNSIIEFRQEQNSWPFSKEEFMNKGKKYRDAFVGFPYLRTEFKVVDDNTMVFSFYDYMKDAQQFKETGKVDINGYQGQVKFYKEKDKFVWKLKMK